MANDKVNCIGEQLQKLQYENEKLFAEHQALKKHKTQAQTLSEESYRKKIKSLTGELEMFDAFADSFNSFCLKIASLHSLSPEATSTNQTVAKQGISKIHANLKSSVAYMREICIDSSLGVPKGKRVQR